MFVCGLDIIFLKIFFNIFSNKKQFILHSLNSQYSSLGQHIILKPGTAWQGDPGPDLLGAGIEQGLRKNMESQARGVDLAKPVDFCFFILKQCLFDFFKKLKLTLVTQWPGQNPEPELWTRPATWPGLETLGSVSTYFCLVVAKTKLKLLN